MLPQWPPAGDGRQEAPPPQEQQQHEDPNINKPAKTKFSKTSGPKSANPYEISDNSWYMPVLLAIGIFIPTVICLCRIL